MTRTATLVAIAALALAACVAPTAAPDGATAPAPTLNPPPESPTHYQVEARFSGAWFCTGWVLMDVVDGVVVAIDRPERAESGCDHEWGTPSLFLESPDHVLAKAANPEQSRAEWGLDLEYTVEWNDAGEATLVCWDDPRAVDEEGCWSYRNWDRNPATGTPRWTEPADYTMGYIQSYFGPAAGAYVVTVRGNQVVGFEPHPDYDWHGDAAHVTLADMESLADIAALYAEAESDGEADAHMLRDLRTGAPLVVNIDWIPDAVDDEVYFTILDVTLD